MTTFTTQRRVEFCDTDMAGMMHFANFFRFMESAEHDYLRSLGLSVIWNEAGQQLGFPRVSASCDYLKPAHYQDMLDISVSVERICQKSVTFSFEFRRDQEVIALGRIATVCCKVTEGCVESIAVPDSFRSKLTQ